MNSAATREPTLVALAEHPEVALPAVPPDFLQSMVPKLDSDTLAPASWPAAPALEWNPPGHGDLYPSLRGSGILDALLEQGFRYAMIANADNLGATVDPRIAGVPCARTDPLPDGGGPGDGGRSEGRPPRPPP